MDPQYRQRAQRRRCEESQYYAISSSVESPYKTERTRRRFNLNGKIFEEKRSEHALSWAMSLDSLDPSEIRRKVDLVGNTYNSQTRRATLELHEWHEFVQST